MIFSIRDPTLCRRANGGKAQALPYALGCVRNVANNTCLIPFRYNSQLIHANLVVIVFVLFYNCQNLRVRVCSVEWQDDYERSGHTLIGVLYQHTLGEIDEIHMNYYSILQ
jgi:hypothetical protein